MPFKQLQLCTLLLLGIGLTGLQAQTMHVKQSDGKQSAYTLNSLRKMTFPPGNLNIHKTDNSTDAFALGKTRYLNFKEAATGIFGHQIQEEHANPVMYPNPVTDLLTIDLKGTGSEAGSITILGLDGKVVHKQNASGKGVITLNLSHLPQGMYICRYAGLAATKTVKIIKK